MYVPPAFREERDDQLAALIASYPLALLISTGDNGPEANPVPMMAHDGVLRCHLARANPQLQQLRQAQELGQPVLAVFQGPQAYISPGWYASKAEHGKVVPTWNYLTVQIRGVPRVIDDADWLRAQVGELTDRFEASSPEPWAVSDAPDRFIEAQLRGIVGVEVPMTEMTGKWKASQNRPEADRSGVIRGLTELGEPLAAYVPPPENSNA